MADSRRSERTVHVARIDAVLDERLCDLGPALEASAVHRSVAVLLGNSNVGSRREQSLDGVELTHQHRVHERRLTARTLAVERGASPAVWAQRQGELCVCGWLARGRGHALERVLDLERRVIAHRCEDVGRGGRREEE